MPASSQRESGIAPLVLLDEVAAHLDRRRRAALYAALDGLGGQVFMTGADAALVSRIACGGRDLRRRRGRVSPLATLEGRPS